jgi:hypothetical protein
MDERPTSERRLVAALRALAADDATSGGASDTVQMRLLDEVRRLRATRRRVFLKTSVLTAALCLAIAPPLWQLAMDHPIGHTVSPGRRLALPRGEMATEFFPLMYSTVPMSSGRLVRVELDRETVMTLGLDAAESTPGSVPHVVVADVLVGDDGLARAVRFVRPVTSGMRKEH